MARARRREAGWRPAWVRALRRDGLSVRDGETLEVRAEPDRGWARARLLEEGAGAHLFAIEASHPAVPDTLSIGPETRMSALAQALLGEDVQVHDPEFDLAVRLRGDPAWILAAFTEKTRARLLPFVEDGFAIEDRRLRGERRLDSPKALAAHLRAANGLMRQLSMSMDEVPRRLIRLATGRGDAAARAAAAEHLMAHAAVEGAQIEGVLRAAALSSAAERRLAWPLLKAWVTADPQRARRFTEEVRLELLVEVPAPAQVIIAEGLAEDGSLRAVPPLRALSTGMFRSRAVKAAAAAALAAVLERTDPVAGGLSVADPAGAGLSLTEEEG